MLKNTLFSTLLTKQTRAGFTVIELLVVVTIMIMLTAVGLVSYQQLGQRARNARRESDLETVRQAMVLYRAENGTYPPVAAWAATMTTISSYISGSEVLDPKNTLPYVYEFVTVGANPTLRAHKEPDPGTVYEIRLP